jgi:ferredoxin
MRIVHDRERCQLHGQCVIAAPDIFSFDDDGELVVLAEPDELLHEQAEDAEGVCPERAIRVEAGVA